MYDEEKRALINEDGRGDSKSVCASQNLQVPQISLKDIKAQLKKLKIENADNNIYVFQCAKCGKYLDLSSEECLNPACKKENVYYEEGLKVDPHTKEHVFKQLHLLKTLCH